MLIVMMGLAHDQWRLMQAGSKMVEIRLYDAKRQSLQVGQRINFQDTQTGEQLLMTIHQLVVFPDFTALFRRYRGTAVGSQPQDSLAQMVREMHTIYSLERERQFGVVAIILTR